MNMNDLLSILNLFGVTPDTYPFLFLWITILAVAAYLRFSLGVPLGKLKDNMLVVVTHLATGRRKLDTSLIKQVSPLRIQPEGRKILEISGFIDLFDMEDNKARFFKIVDANQPRSKLDVENYSILAFLKVLTKDGMMGSVQSYLYQHPDTREVFATLAGVYIRDKYLECHPEIAR